MMTKILPCFFILASIFTALLAVPAMARAGEQEFLPRADFSALNRNSVRTVIDVIDPLTLKLDDGRTIALAGLDYPDLDYYAPGQIASTAMKILKDMLLNRKVAVYQTKEAKAGRINRMGHHIAHLAREEDGVWAQGAMLALGLARVRTTGSNPEMAAQMYALEKAARESKTGLWSVTGYSVLTPEEAEKHIGSFAVVEGAVRSAAMKSNRLYLNFGNDWRKDFTVSISAADRRAFHKAGLDPQQWGGKKLRVRGWISSYNGPYIEIDHPERFELLFDQDAQTTAQAEPSAEKTDEKAESSDMMDDNGSALPAAP